MERILADFRKVKKALRQEDRDVGPARRKHRKAERKLTKALKRGDPTSITDILVKDVEKANIAWLLEAEEAQAAREATALFQSENAEDIKAAQARRCNARLAAVLDVAEMVMAVGSAGSPLDAINIGVDMVLDHPDIPLSEENRAEATSLVKALIE